MTEAVQENMKVMQENEMVYFNIFIDYDLYVVLTMGKLPRNSYIYNSMKDALAKINSKRGLGGGICLRAPIMHGGQRYLIPSHFTVNDVCEFAKFKKMELKDVSLYV